MFPWTCKKEKNELGALPPLIKVISDGKIINRFRHWCRRALVRYHPSSTPPAEEERWEAGFDPLRRQEPVRRGSTGHYSMVAKE